MRESTPDLLRVMQVRSVYRGLRSATADAYDLLSAASSSVAVCQGLPNSGSFGYQIGYRSHPARRAPHWDAYD